MFEYNLKGKQVILSLDEEYVQHLKPYGIQGSPLLAKVHRMEEQGLWLESDSFKLCPQGVPKLFRPSGEAFCRAHIFVPAKAIVAAVAFPAHAAHLHKDPNLHRIGFRPRKTRSVSLARRKRKDIRPGPRKRISLPGSHTER